MRVPASALALALVLTGGLRAAEPFVVATYNIRSAAGNGNLEVLGRELPHLVTRPRKMPDRIAMALHQQRVDLVGLQEAQGRGGRSLGVDQPKRIARRLGMQHTFKAAKKGLFGITDNTGNAVLSAYEIRHKEGFKVSGSRSANLAIVDHPAFPEGMLIVNTHLSTGRDGAPRREELEVIAERIAAHRLPTVMMGDFNAQPDSDEIRWLLAGGMGREFVDAHAAAGAGEGLTAPALEPRHRIDYIFVTPDLAVQEVRAIEEYAPLSDHLPVVATLVPAGSLRRPPVTTQALPGPAAWVGFLGQLD